MLKSLKGRNLKTNKQANRSLGECGEKEKSVRKGEYRKELGKLSDRFVPFLHSYE